MGHGDVVTQPDLHFFNLLRADILWGCLARIANEGLREIKFLSAF
jgi:hypothetical protein